MASAAYGLSVISRRLLLECLHAEQLRDSPMATFGIGG